MIFRNTATANSPLVQKTPNPANPDNTRHHTTSRAAIYGNLMIVALLFSIS